MVPIRDRPVRCNGRRHAPARKLSASQDPAGHEGHAMSTVPASWPERFHEVGFYRSDAEFRALIVPFVEDGVAAGQPVIIGYDDRPARWRKRPSPCR
jgi:hypothetical protein